MKEQLHAFLFTYDGYGIVFKSPTAITSNSAPLLPMQEVKLKSHSRKSDFSKSKDACILAEIVTEGMRNAIMRNGQSDKMGLAEFQAKTDEEIKNKQFTHRPS